MLIISAEIMKIINERERQKNPKQTKKKRTSGTEGIVKEWELNDFVVGLSCGFSQIKSNILLALSIILKERELNESKHVAVECRCLKMRLVILFDVLLNPSFKMMTGFANIARTNISAILNW